MLAESEPRTTISFINIFIIAFAATDAGRVVSGVYGVGRFGFTGRMRASMRKSACRKARSRPRQQLYTFDPALDGVRLNIALEDDGKSFWVLRMKVRDRIVADGIDDPSFGRQ
ncbi:hypothetical protein KCP76_25435 [Salmonella enterica subsp. enterica serovar Weltevreden]|nr:hypothetical protein KCP76_25435 [Salmonella enterica subsp. enterica serovar Weltevreden]